MNLSRRTLVASLAATPFSDARIVSQVADGRGGTGNTPITSTSFGMHLVGITGWDQGTQEPTPLQTFGCGSVRVWDTGATWRRLQPSSDSYDWSTLDAEMSLWTRKFKDVLFCFGQAPDWATAPFRGRGTYNPNAPHADDAIHSFIAALLERYPAIAAVEVWNEPNFPQYFNGSVDQLARITGLVATAVRASRPGVRVLTAAPQPFADNGLYFSRYLDALNRTGTARMIDVLSFHTYVQPREPEVMGTLIDKLIAIARLQGFRQPAWSTEFGWGIYRDWRTGAVIRDTPMSSDQATAYILRGFLVSLGRGLERQYFYAADKSFSALRLLKPNKRAVTAAGAALERLSKLLVGGWVGRLVDRGDHFEQPFTTAEGRSGRAVWTRDGDSAQVPLNGATARSFLGEPIKTRGNGSVTVGPLPIYLI